MRRFMEILQNEIDAIERSLPNYDGSDLDYWAMQLEIKRRHLNDIMDMTPEDRDWEEALFYGKDGSDE